MNNQENTNQPGISLNEIFNHPAFPSKLQMVISKAFSSKQDILSEAEKKAKGSGNMARIGQLKLKRDVLDGLIDLGYFKVDRTLISWGIEMVDSVKIVKEYLLILAKKSNLTSVKRQAISYLVEQAVVETYTYMVAETKKLEETQKIRQNMTDKAAKRTTKAKLKTKPDETGNKPE